MPAAKKTIYELLPEVQKLIGAIGKDNVNSHQRYNFRGIDDVLNAIGPALAKVGVVCTAEVTSHEREEVATQKGYRVNVTLFLRVKFFGPDGSFVENVTVGEAQDHNGDKATNKAMSVAFKYAAFMGLAIPVEPGVLDDSDHDDKPAGNPPAGKSKPSSKSSSGGKAQTKASGSTSSKGSTKDSSGSSASSSAKKSPPNEFDGKPAHTSQLKEIASAMMEVTGEDDPKADANQDKLRALLDYVNKQRKDTEIPGEAVALKDLYYVEAEKVMKLLAPQVKKARAAAESGDTNE